MPEKHTFGILSLTIWLPTLGALLLGFIPRSYVHWHRYIALIFTLATFAVSLSLYFLFSANTFHFQFVESIPWIPQLGIQYKLGIDGISLWLVLLTTFITVIAVWFSFYVGERAKEFMMFMLILETALLGVFSALDLALFYIFFEATLIPMYFLIAIWGSEQKRAYAAIKFFLFTFLGSIFMLVAIIYLCFVVASAEFGRYSFDLLELQALASRGELVSGTVAMWVFAAFAVSFAVKVPFFPLHTWLPDAHTEAPTAGSIILAAIMLKMGTYGFLRFCFPLFPEASLQAAPFMMGLALVGILYGAVMAAVQPDWKRLVAYSSVSHLGFVMLGAFALNHNGLTGSILQSLNHGVSTGALFLLVGMIYERRHTRLFSEYGGLKRQMPMFATLFLIIMLSSVGLPSMNGFIGEFLCLLGAFEAGMEGTVGISMVIPVLAAGGVVLAAVYLLWMFQKAFYGKCENAENRRLRDIKPWEQFLGWSLVLFVFWVGLYPTTFTSKMEASVNALRHQTLLPAGKRPVWSDMNVDINSRGDVVEVLRRTQQGEWTEGRVLVPANHHAQRSMGWVKGEDSQTLARGK
ncbi:MAG TPA: NADH-quinone oxidoreductase subunit M [Fimbriimonadales bacterium]|nr:NADH-quinone oxidoreductase subunit M [Fimbriimonadales bacterium]